MLYLSGVEKAGPCMIYVANLRYKPESQVQDCPPDCEKGFMQGTWALEGTFQAFFGGRVANLRRKFQDFCWDLFLNDANPRRLRKKGRAARAFISSSLLFSMYINVLEMWHAPCKWGRHTRIAACTWRSPRGGSRIRATRPTHIIRS